MVGNFIAQFELPKFIPWEEIIRKRVYDSQVAYIGIVEDWTYGSDGRIGMVVRKKKGTDILRTLIPFSHIDRVGEYVMLKTERDKYTATNGADNESSGAKSSRLGGLFRKK